MYDMEWKITKWRTWSKKFDRNLRHEVRNKNEINELEGEIRSKGTTWSKKLDRNLRHGMRNKNEMKDLE